MQVLRILTKWSKSIPNFKEVYTSLPFRSATIEIRETLELGSLACGVADRILMMVPINPNEPAISCTIAGRPVTSKLMFEVIINSGRVFGSQLWMFVTLRNFWGIRPGSFVVSLVALHTGNRKMPPTPSVTSLLLRTWITTLSI